VSQSTKAQCVCVKRYAHSLKILDCEYVCLCASHLHAVFVCEKVHQREEVCMSNAQAFTLKMCVCVCVCWRGGGGGWGVQLFSYLLSADRPLGPALLSKGNYLISTAGRRCVREKVTEKKEDKE